MNIFTVYNSENNEVLASAPTVEELKTNYPAITDIELEPSKMFGSLKISDTLSLVKINLDKMVNKRRGRPARQMIVADIDASELDFNL